MRHYDYLIVGSGLFGSTIAYRIRNAGKSCLVIDKRRHLGGNVFCENIEGINIHKYGAHIFHTSNKRLWDFVNSLVEFNRYTNSPMANYKGALYNLPFNMNTFHRLWNVTTPDDAIGIISEQRADCLAKMRMDGAIEARNLEEQAKLLVGEDIFEILIKGYTEKQWGRSCSALPPFIIKRIPIRLTFDNNYFSDRYQGIPIGGYNKLIDALLENVEYELDADFFLDRGYWESVADTIIYTGPVDQWFDYAYGPLNYRTVRFDTKVLETSNFQGNAVINYTDSDVPYTRIIEHKHFEMFGDEVYDNPKTVISYEFPMEWSEGLEPYYPINDKVNGALAGKYLDLTKTEKNVVFGGRLAEYRYYDMAPVMEKAFSIEL